MQLQFLGATETVTGSKYLIENEGEQFLVDCGLFQGLKNLRLRNREPLPIGADKLEAAVITHAHLDHSGYLPKLVKEGFRGRIHCTPPTEDICRILLPDAGMIMEEEAEYANRMGFSKHHPAKPLYTEKDAREVFRYFSNVPFGEPFRPISSVEAVFHPAAHILGASFVELKNGKTTVVFSGDLGRPDDPVFSAPPAPPAADYLVIESTYGSRRHPKDDVLDQIEEVVRETVGRGGVLVVPAFAVGRTQMLLLYLSRLRDQGRLPDVPIYLDSPMATDVTELYRSYMSDHRISEKECRRMFRAVNLIRTFGESQSLHDQREPMIIVSASGMATGGRVVHHLKRYAPDPKNTILFTGYQAAGTRGASILAGAEAVKIHGRYVPIKAEVRVLDSLSAHADSDELIRWMSAMHRAPKKVFITHGEPASSDALRLRIQDELGWKAVVPDYLSRHTLK